MRVPLCLIITVLLVFSAVSAGLDPDDLITDEVPPVNVLGKGLFKTINSAIKASKDGDVLVIAQGTYDEPVVIDKSLTILGDGPMNTYTSTWWVRVPNVKIEGHTFQNIYSTDWNRAAGVTTQQSPASTTSISGLIVKNCIFNNVQHGVYLFGATYATIEDCTFNDSWRGVSIQNQRIGSGARYSHHNTVQRCTFTNLKENSGCEGEAVAINDTDYNIVKDNTMDNCPWGVMVYRGDNNVIEGNTITNCSKDPIYICSVSTQTTIDDNTIMNNKGNVDIRHTASALMTDNVLSNNTGPIHILNSARMTLTGNDINGSSIFLDRSQMGTFGTNTFTTTDMMSFDFRATSQAHYNHAIATSNKVNGNPIHYYYASTSPVVSDTTAGSIMFAYCSNPNATNVDVEDGDGIRLVNSRYTNITANVTNCLVGIDAVYSGDGLIEDCRIDTSARGRYGIRMLESMGTDVHDTTITTTTAPAWVLEGADIYECYNTTFPYTSILANLNGGGELWAYADLTVSIQKDETLVPMDGVEMHLTEDTTPMYSTPHFGGTDPVTDSSGTIGPITLLDRVYKNYQVPIEHDHDLDLYLNVDDTWTAMMYNINMSKDKLLVFETSDIWKPGMPGNMVVTDLPDEDALEVSWDLNSDDTVTYSLWTNMSGSWDLLDNLTSDVSTYRIDQGLVHGVDYWFALSAWDEVPLESDRTVPAMVTHVDGVAPDAPTGLVASEVNGTDLTLVWDANQDLDLEGYRVYINDTGGDENGPWVLLTASAGFMDTTLWVQGLASETVYHFVVTAIDERPNESPHSQVLKATTDDITPPEAPVIDELPQWTNVKSRTITGMGEAGATLRLLLNGDPLDEVTVGSTGDFSVQVQLLEGENIFSARCIDPSGNIGPLSGEVTTILDTVLPDAPDLDALPALTNVVEHTVSGTAEAYSTVTVMHNGEVLGTYETGADGAFELAITLVEGENVITAFATDRAANDGPNANLITVVLDTIAPAAPVMEDLPEYTNVATHTVNGTAEPDSDVELLVGDTVVGSVTADEDGDFEFALVLEGRLTVIMTRATDAAGNVGPGSDTITIILDQEPPVAVAGEDAEAVEDTEVTFDGSTSSDNEGIASYGWSFELDGSPVTLDGETGTYTFPDVVVVTVTLTVTDLAGNVDTDTMEMTIISSNLPPTLRRDEMTPDDGHTNTKFKFTVEFKDPDGDTGEVWIHIDGERFLMGPDPEDTDPADGQTYIYETKLGKGEHTYYFTGRDSFGNDAEGSSVGPDNAKSSPDIEKKKVSDSPALGLVAALGAMLMLAVALRGRKR